MAVTRRGFLGTIAAVATTGLAIKKVPTPQPVTLHVGPADLLTDPDYQFRLAAQDLIKYQQRYAAALYERVYAPKLI